MRLNTNGILRKCEKEFENRVDMLQRHIYEDVSNASGSFPGVGVRTGNLRKSLQKIRLSKFNHRLGVMIGYAYHALNKKGSRYRHLIGPDGSFKKYWSSLFK